MPQSPQWSPICDKCGRPIRGGKTECPICHTELPPPSETKRSGKPVSRSLEELQNDAKKAGIEVPEYKGVVICSKRSWSSWINAILYLAIAVFIGWVIWQAWPKS